MTGLPQELTQYTVIECSPTRWYVYAQRGEVKAPIAWRKTKALAEEVKRDMEQRTAELYQQVKR